MVVSITMQNGGKGFGNWAQFFAVKKSDQANLSKRSGEPGRT